MKCPVYHDPSRATINLALPWHSSVVEIADRNFNFVTGKLNKCMKSLNPAIPWSPKDFFSGLGYHTHNLEGNVPKPESLVILFKHPPKERTAEDQPFFLVHRHPDDPCLQVDISSGSFAINAAQFVDHEALARKTAAAIIGALSIAEYS